MISDELIIESQLLEEVSKSLGKTVNQMKRILTATKTVDSIDQLYEDSSRPIIENYRV